MKVLRLTAQDFHTKLLCQKPTLRQIEWGVGNGPITKNGVLPVTTFFFRKFCFSLITLHKEVIWWTNYTNVHTHIWESVGVLLEDALSLWISLNSLFYHPILTSYLMLFCRDIHQFFFSNANLQHGLASIIDYMIIFKFHVYMEWKFQLGLFESWWSFCSVYRRDEVFHIIVILFLHCYRLPCETKSYHGLMSWNFILGLKSRFRQPLRRSFLRK